MRAIATVLAGFTLTLGVFASGALLATWYLAAEPVPAGLAQDQTGLWSDTPKTVVPSEQAFERLPAREVAAETVAAAPAPEPDVTAAVDPAVTASVEPEAEADPRDAQTEALLLAHIDWCASRYRSYRPQDNSYTAYSGERRDCISPHVEALTAEGPGTVDDFAIDSLPDEDGAEVGYVSYAAGGFDDEHVASCLARYRSYRVEDNSYQPYGGGPRQPCE